jgi:hypothetical protein
MRNDDVKERRTSSGDESLDDELVRVLDGYLADLEAGGQPDPARLLAAHPALADRLKGCLAVFQAADALADKADPDRTAVLEGVTPLPNGDSVLTSLWTGLGPPPHILLRDPEGSGDPLALTRSDSMPVSRGNGVARYQLLGEIARGGMGAVLKGRDVDLGRDLAIKV